MKNYCSGVSMEEGVCSGILGRGTVLQVKVAGSIPDKVIGIFH